MSIAIAIATSEWQKHRGLMSPMLQGSSKRKAPLRLELVLKLCLPKVYHLVVLVTSYNKKHIIGIGVKKMLTQFVHIITVSE